MRQRNLTSREEAWSERLACPVRLPEEPFEPAGHFEFYSISIRYRVSTNEAVCRFLNVLSEIGLSQLKVTDTKECSIFWNDPARSLF